MDEPGMMKVLAVPSDQAGCGHYRMLQPSRVVAEHYPATVHVHPNPDPALVKDYDLVLLQRIRYQASTSAGNAGIEWNQRMTEAAQAAGVPVIYDLDDNDAVLPRHHGMYLQFERDRIAEREAWLLHHADAVTTTTPYLAAILKEQGKRMDPVYVFPNCLDENDPKWNHVRERNTRRVRIGWAGGSSHLRDLKCLDGVFPALYRQYGDKLLFFIGGFDTRGEIAYIEGDSLRSRPLEVHETPWRDMVHILFGAVPQSAQRIIETLSIEQYGFIYSQMDIGVVPLEDHEFNRSKSELKLLEFGIYGVPLVVSAVLPYTDPLVGTDVVDFVPPGASPDVWIEALTPLIEDPVYRDARGQQLRAYILRHYSAHRWAPHRWALWQAVVGRETPPIPPTVREIVHEDADD